MDFMDFDAMIPVVSILASFGFAWIGLRYYELRLESRCTERAYVEQTEEKHRLEKRLAVLERIVTDRGLETAEQIEALRERPRAREVEALAIDKGGNA